MLALSIYITPTQTYAGPNTLARLYNNGNCTMCTYAHPNCRHCIGYFNRGAGLSIHNVSTTTFVWTFCIVVMHFLYVM